MDAFKIFDTLLEPVFVLNAETKVVYCNEPAALLVDSSPRKIIRSQVPFTELFQFSEKISGLDDIKSITESTSYQEVSFTTAQGKTGKIQVTVQFYEQLQSESHWLVYTRDVTLEETLQKKYRAELDQKEHVIVALQKAQQELENYSKNLERMVEERTTEIKELNKQMTALLDSLSQGFFIFDRQGKCTGIYSKACLKMFEQAPQNIMFWELLNTPTSKVEGIQKWLTTLFADMLPFEDLSSLGPNPYINKDQRTIQMEYYPIRSADGSLESIVAVATDITDLLLAQKELESEKSHAKMILEMIKNRKNLYSFLAESEQIIADTKNSLNQQPLDIESLYRAFHTLKGGAGSFFMHKIVEHCHHSETLVQKLKNTYTKEDHTELKKYLQLIDHEFHIFWNDYAIILGSKDKSQNKAFEVYEDQLLSFNQKFLLPNPEISHAFLENFLSEPVQDYFKNHSEMIRNLAEQLGKEVLPIKIVNGELKIFASPYQSLFSSMVHAFRNAIDHGLEPAFERQEAGKNPSGLVTLSFEKQKDLLQIHITDDGKGISPERIRAKLDKLGVDHKNESDNQVIQHIFDSQFSTQENVSEISGRGVGMDAIAFEAKALSGKAWVESVVGQGTTLVIEVPWITPWAKQTSKKVA